MKQILLALSLAVLAACAPARPDVGGSVGSNGPAAHAGVSSGRVNAGVSTNGAYAGVDVVQTQHVNAGVGTGGAYGSVRLGSGPVKVGIGRNGWRVGF